MKHQQLVCCQFTSWLRFSDFMEYKDIFYDSNDKKHAIECFQGYGELSGCAAWIAW